jgi:ABC-type dipeptide/oligopeptide/nickel transport system permease subunit
MRLLITSARFWATVTGVGILAAVGILIAIGYAEPRKWSTDVWAGGFLTGSNTIRLPPFPIFSSIRVFDINVQEGGTHFFLLGSDAGGRDLLALIARGALPSLGLVALVVLVRFTVGFLAGLAMGMGSRLVRTVSRAMGRWVIGFPYLALAIIAIEAFGASSSRILAFVVGMGLVGWRDIAELVSERVEHVRSQPYAMAAKSLGTEGLTFFRLHVIPHLRPALAVEIPFQASAVLVLLAELGYLQLYLGSSTQLFDVAPSGASFVSSVLINQPELGQLLAGARTYILQRQFEPAVMPALAVAVMALGFELVGVAMRVRKRGRAT